MKLVTLILGLVATTLCHAYDPSAPRKIAAPEDTAFDFLSGYDSFTGAYKQSCVKKVAPKPLGVDPNSVAVIEAVNSLSEVTNSRKLDVHASLNLNFGLSGGSAKVNTSFAKKHKTSIESSAVSLSFVDMRKPRFVPPRANYEFNKRGKQAYAQLAKGAVQKFRQTCGDSVVVGQQSGRRLTGVATVESTNSNTQIDRQTQVDIAARYMLSKANASVGLNESETRIAKDLKIDINYEISGNSRQSGATTPDELRSLFVEFPKDRNSTSVQFVYLLPLLDLVDAQVSHKGMATSEARKIQAIIDGFNMLVGARNASYAELQHRKRYNRVKWAEANHLTKTTDGIHVPKLRDEEMVEKSFRALKREVGFLSGKIREQRGCLPAGNKSTTLNKECESLYRRLFPVSKAMQMDSASKNRWMKKFLTNAYASSDACEKGFVVSLPSGMRKCQRCGVAKEPRFANGREGTCGYIASKRASKSETRFWAKDFAKQANGVTRFPNRCKKPNSGCGQAAATTLCKKKGFKRAAYFEIWDWRPDNSIHYKPYVTAYASGKLCTESKDEFTPKRCRAFKLVDCTNSTAKKSKNQKKKKSVKKKNKA